MITPKEAEKFFFRAMRKGYANVTGTQPLQDTPHPGWKTITYTEGHLRLTDMWYTTPGSDQSGGVTTISSNETIVWAMHYSGWYPEEAIETLKKALWATYKSDIFIGGRGPYWFETGQYLYENIAESEDFAKFAGIEFIRRLNSREVIGSHWYHGQWILGT